MARYWKPLKILRHNTGSVPFNYSIYPQALAFIQVKQKKPQAHSEVMVSFCLPCPSSVMDDFPFVCHSFCLPLVIPMSHQCHSTPSLPAPCVVSTGILVNKSDMKRLLQDLAWVRYAHYLDGEVKEEGEGWVVEVFDDEQQATLVVNQSLYLNLHSFDYLALKKTETGKTYFELVQDNRVLRLDVAEKPHSQPFNSKTIPESTLEEMVTQVLSARWDVHLDDEENFNF